MDALGCRLHDRHARPFPTTAAPSSRAISSSATCCCRDSGMRHHPLTPMTDANLVRVLQAQTPAPGRPGRLRGSVAQGAGARSATRIAALRAEGVAHRDRRCDRQRRPAAPRRGASQDMPLVTRRLGRRDRPAGELRHRACPAPAPLPRRDGLSRRSSRAAARSRPTRRCAHSSPTAAPRFALDPLRARPTACDARRRRRWPGPSRWLRATARCWSTRPRRRQAVQSVQARLGVARRRRAGRGALAAVARGLVERGVRQLVVAGGETSGACVQALGIAQLRIGAADRSRRALVPCGRARGRAAAACTWRSSRATSARVDFFIARLRRGCAMNETQAARRDLPRRAQSCSSAAMCTRTAGNISVRRRRRRFLITPTDACLGFLDPARLATARCRTARQHRRRPRQQDPRPAPRIYARRRRDRRAA